MKRRTRFVELVAVAGALVLASVACSSSSTNSSTNGTPAGTNPTGGSTPLGTTANTNNSYIVFNGQGNNLDAYEPNPPFKTQRVNTAFGADKGRVSDPNGTDINAQICFFPDGSDRFIAGEDKNQTKGDLQGWGIFKLSGNTVGKLSISETAKLVPTYQGAKDNAENYGCGFLSDGRILTSDVGNQAIGPADGQLIVWFPPFDSHEVRFCKIDTQIATAQSILVDDKDNVYLAAARPGSEPGDAGSGVWKYSGPFPTSNTAAGGCGKTDVTGAPMVDTMNRTQVLTVGEHGLLSPSGLAWAPNGGYYVSSVASGVINQYDSNWQFVKTILQPPSGEVLDTDSFSTGTPLGIGVGPDGTLFYADIGVIFDPKEGIGPGNGNGHVRRITFTAGKPNPPEIMASDLDYPDGIGIFVPAP